MRVLPLCSTLLTGQYGALGVGNSLGEGGLSKRSHSGEAGLVLGVGDLYPCAGVLVSLLLALQADGKCTSYSVTQALSL